MYTKLNMPNFKKNYHFFTFPLGVAKLKPYDILYKHSLDLYKQQY